MQMKSKPFALALASAALSLTALGATTVMAASHPTSAEPDRIQPVTTVVGVTLDDDLLEMMDDQHLGMREVQEKADQLSAMVGQAMADNPQLAGARAQLVLTRLSPNRPTFEQLASRPGLDAFRSISIGGAEIKGEIITADGRSVPVDYSWFSHSIADSRYATTWQDADRAFERFARRVARGERLN